MRHEKPTEDCLERAALYALGTMNQHEAGAIDAHMREGCQICRKLVIHFRRVAGAAGLAAPETEPPAYLRDLLAARIERESATLVAPLGFSDTGEVESQPPPRSVRWHRSRPARRRSLLPWALVLVFAVIALLCLYLWWDSRDALAWQQSRAADAYRKMNEQRTTLETERLRGRELEMIRGALADPGARIIALEGQDSFPTVAGAVFWDPVRNRWLVSATLPPPPNRREYQLWYVQGSSRTSAALLKQDSEGHVFAAIDLPPDMTGLTGALISLEQDGGSERPTVICARGALCP